MFVWCWVIACMAADVSEPRCNMALLCSSACMRKLTLPLPQTLTKESHFFAGALGRGSTSSRAAYRSYFPTLLRRWWVEAVERSGKVG